MRQKQQNIPFKPWFALAWIILVGPRIEVSGAPGNHPDLDEVTWKGHIYAPPSGHNG